MADLRNMTVGISFRDDATAGINRINSQMDSLASDFGGMGGLASSAGSEMNSFGQVGASALNSIADGADNVNGGLNHVSDSVSDVGDGLNSLNESVLNDVEDSADNAADSTDDLTGSLQDVDNELGGLSGRTLNEVRGEANDLNGALGDTTDSLRNAERGLDNINGSSLNDVGDAADSAAGDVQDLGNQVDNVGSKFSGLSGIVIGTTRSIASSIGRGITAPLRGAIGMVKKFGGVFGLLSGGALASAGMNRLSAIEGAKTSLSVMMGDAGEASKFMDDVLAFAKTTPFAFPDLAESSRNLIAFGMDKAKVVPTLKAIGDAAAATGKGAEGFDQISSAFGGMQVASKLSLGPIRSLESAGVNALTILANEAGVSADSMSKSITKGSIDSKKAIDILVKGMQEGSKGIAGETVAMAGIMEDMKDTWAGSVDSMKSSISSTMAKIMEPAKPHIQAAMGWFGKTFSKLPPVVFGVVDKIKPAFDAVTPVFEKTVTAFGGIVKIFKGGIIWNTKGILDLKKMGLTNEQAQKVVSLVESVKSGIADAFEKIKEFGLGIKSEVGDNFSDIIDKGLDFAIMIRDNWGPIKETVIGIGVAVGSFALIMGGLSVIGKINTLMAAYRAGTLVATAAQMGLNLAMLASPITWVVLGIAALIAVGVLLWRNWDTIKLKASELWEVIKEKWIALKTWTSEVWDGVKTGISESMESAKTSVSNFFSPLMEFLGSVKAKWDDLVGAFKNFEMPKIKLPSMPNWMKSGGGVAVDGSNADGLERVPYDGYISELHKDESVLTAQQSNSLRSMGILGNRGDLPVLNLPTGKGSQEAPSPTAASPVGQTVTKSENNNTFVFNISGENAKDIRAEIREELEAIFTRLNAGLA